MKKFRFINVVVLLSIITVCILFYIAIYCIMNDTNVVSKTQGLILMISFSCFIISVLIEEILLINGKDY